MRQTIERLKNLAERLKLLSALAALFLSGALLTMGVSAAYYDRVISKIHGSYGGRIAALNADIRRLQKEVDHERGVNRDTLHDQASQLREQAVDIDKLSDDVGRLIHMIEETATTAAKAASTARSAATTAQGAAANAAKSTIRVTEIPPEPEPVERTMPKPRIEH